MISKGPGRSVFMVLLLMVVGFSSVSNADTLVGFTDTNAGTYTSISVFNLGYSDGPELGAVYSSWTQSVATNNVSVSALLGDFGMVNHPAQGVAYLMNALGPSATVANQLAFANFTAPILTEASDLTGQPYTPLFSGLNLDPGTYYLVIYAVESPNAFGWYGDHDTQTTLLADGFNTGPTGVCSTLQGIPCTPAAYAPASDFAAIGSTSQPFYRVEAMQTATVPEPTTLMLMLTPGVGVLVRRFRR